MYRHEVFHCDRSIGLFTIDEIAKNLKENSYWVSAVDDQGNTPLHIAAKNKEISFVRAMIPHLDRVNTYNNQGDTVLHIFIDNCMKNEVDYAEKHASIRTLISKSTYFNKKHRIIRSLLAMGADINFKNRQGITPAQIAAKHGYIDVLKIFKSSKQCLNVGRGENLLHLLCNNAKSEYKDTPMEMKVMSYLIKQGCDVNAMDSDDYSPLHYALETRSFETVKKLLQLGFDFPRWNKKLVSNMLLRASAVSNASVVRFLIEQGANVNVKNMSGMTPLHFASSRNRVQQYDTMEMLLKAGAHIDATDDAGLLPLDYALKNKNVAGLECLMEFGVDVINTTSFHRLTLNQVLDCWYVEKFVLKHLTQLKAVGFQINPIYEPYLKITEWRKYKRICLEEVKELKLCMIDDHMSLYDLLHMKTKNCRYTHLPKLLRNLKSSFPIYYGIIRIRIHEIEKKLLIKPATLAWYDLTNINLPYICVENILSHLNSCCLRMMINSCEDKIIYNSVVLQAKWLEES